MAPEVMNVKADMLSEKLIEIYEFVNHRKIIENLRMRKQTD